MLTLVWGCFWTISRVASMPLLPGRRMSITTTSGLNSSVRAMASLALLASATTWKLGWRASSAFSPRRTTSWSSTSRILSIGLPRLWIVAIIAIGSIIAVSAHDDTAFEMAGHHPAGGVLAGG